MTAREKRIFRIAEKLHQKLLVAAVEIQATTCTCPDWVQLAEPQRRHQRGCGGVMSARPYFRFVDWASKAMRKLE